MIRIRGVWFQTFKIRDWKQLIIYLATPHDNKSEGIIV